MPFNKDFEKKERNCLQVFFSDEEKQNRGAAALFPWKQASCRKVTQTEIQEGTRGLLGIWQEAKSFLFSFFYLGWRGLVTMKTFEYRNGVTLNGERVFLVRRWKSN